MFDYLQKFNSLDKELKDKVSNSQAMAVIDDLEKKHNISLAPLVIKIMIKELKFENLKNILFLDFKLSLKEAEVVSNILRKDLFKDLEDYLEIQNIPQEEIKKDTKKDEQRLTPPIPKISDKNKKSQEKDVIKEKVALDRNKNKVNADFFFSAEDEEEVNELSKKIGLAKENHLNSSNEKLDKLIIELSINFSSSILKERFRKILNTYLSGVRNRIDTKSAMMKPIENGGLGIKDEVSIGFIIDTKSAMMKFLLRYYLLQKNISKKKF